MFVKRLPKLSVLLFIALGVALLTSALLTSPTQTTTATSLKPNAITQLTHDPGNALRPA